MATLLDSYSEANADSGEGSLQFGGTLKLGQSFAAGNGRTLDSVKFYIRKAGTPPGNIVAEVFAHSGTFGSSSVGTGSALATSDTIIASTLPSSLSLVEFTFSGANRITLDSSYYVIVVSYSDSGSSGSNNIRLTWDESSPTHSGNFIYYSEGTSWGANSGRDLPFYVYYDSALSETFSETFSETTTIDDTLSRNFSRTVVESLTITAASVFTGISKLLGKVVKGGSLIGKVASSFITKGRIK